MEQIHVKEISALSDKRCSKCNQIKDISEFHRLSSSKDGYRPDCKACCKAAKEKYKADNSVYYCCNRLANSLLRRLRETDNPRNKCYKGVECRLGKTPSEIAKVLKDNFSEDIKRLLDEGKIPSIDRKNSSKHYELSNIQIIDFLDNSLKGLKNAIATTSKGVIAEFQDGSTQQFSSISEASRNLSTKRDTIYAHLDKGTKTKSGISFYSVFS